MSESEVKTLPDGSKVYVKSVESKPIEPIPELIDPVPVETREYLAEKAREEAIERQNMPKSLKDPKAIAEALARERYHRAKAEEQQQSD